MTATETTVFAIASGVLFIGAVSLAGFMSEHVQVVMFGA